VKKGNNPEAPADQPALEEQTETDGIAGNTHDAEGMDDACRNIAEKKRHQGVDPAKNKQKFPQRKDGVVFPVERDKEYQVEKVTEQSPECNRQSENDGPWALGNRVTIYRPRYRAKTGIRHIGVIAVVGLD
jgi:hypothetical protein